MKLTFEADVDGQPKLVQMRFGNERDLAELRRWCSPLRHVEQLLSVPALGAPASRRRVVQCPESKTRRRDAGAPRFLVPMHVGSSLEALHIRKHVARKSSFADRGKT